MRRSSSYTELSLFPEDRPVPDDAVDSIQVKLSGLELRRPRPFGNCWLACELWHQLGLDEFWRDASAGRPGGGELGEGAAAAGGEPAAGSGQRVSRASAVVRGKRHGRAAGRRISRWRKRTGLYRCLDRLLEHKQDLFVWLKQKWADLFRADFEVLLYDLTSTYFEGEMEQNPKAKRGYSRDSRPDCLQVVIALVVTPDGFPLAYEVMDGNTSEQTTLRRF